MLKITVPATELFDEEHNSFIKIKETQLQLEHSLVSISKWESKWHKPFLSRTEEKTTEMYIDYVRCMTLTQNVNPLIYYGLTAQNMEDIQKYIDNPMTATWFSNQQKKENRKIITSEVIYYWMVALQIPFECQKWHLNRLLTLIRVCNIENQPKKKMSKKATRQSNASINAARRQAMNSKG